MKSLVHTKDFQRHRNAVRTTVLPALQGGPFSGGGIPMGMVYEDRVKTSCFWRIQTRIQTRIRPVIARMTPRGAYSLRGCKQSDDTGGKHTACAGGARRRETGRIPEPDGRPSRRDGAEWTARQKDMQTGCGLVYRYVPCTPRATTYAGFVAANTSYFGGRMARKRKLVAKKMIGRTTFLSPDEVRDLLRATMREQGLTAEAFAKEIGMGMASMKKALWQKGYERMGTLIPILERMGYEVGLAISITPANGVDEKKALQMVEDEQNMAASPKPLWNRSLRNKQIRSGRIRTSSK